jgi:hypothetical protein
VKSNELKIRSWNHETHENLRWVLDLTWGLRQIEIVEDTCEAPWAATACCSFGQYSPAASPEHWYGKDPMKPPLAAGCMAESGSRAAAVQGLRQQSSPKARCIFTEPLTSIWKHINLNEVVSAECLRYATPLGLGCVFLMNAFYGGGLLRHILAKSSDRLGGKMPPPQKKMRPDRSPTSSTEKPISVKSRH